MSLVWSLLCRLVPLFRRRLLKHADLFLFSFLRRLITGGGGDKGEILHTSLEWMENKDLKLAGATWDL